MTEQELEKCRKLYNEKMDKIKRFKELLDDEKVKEVLNTMIEHNILTKEVIKEEYNQSPTEIVDSFIEKLSLKGTEGLYYVRAEFGKEILHRKYVNLENPNLVIHRQNDQITEFENKNLVLTRCNKDNYQKVLNKFISLSLSSGVEQARVKILHLYL